MSKHIVIEEAELIQLLRDQSEAGFNILYTNYSSAIYGIAMKMLENAELAEDITQEAFVKIWNNISQYNESKGRLFTWMLNLTRNLCIDKIRSKEYNNSRQNQELENSVHTIDREQNTSLNPDWIGVKKWVKKLPSDTRLIIELMYFKGYTQSEIADEFNIPLGTVKTRARSGIQTLRNIFAQNTAEPNR